jgi:acetyl-CoA synthetase
VGSPDKERGMIVKAFIKVKEGFTPAEELQKEIQEFVKTKLSKHEYPREIEFIEGIPKTADGKIKRKVLKEREIGKKLGQQSLYFAGKASDDLSASTEKTGPE